MHSRSAQSASREDGVFDEDKKITPRQDIEGFFDNMNIGS